MRFIVYSIFRTCSAFFFYFIVVVASSMNYTTLVKSLVWSVISNRHILMDAANIQIDRKIRWRCSNTGASALGSTLLWLVNCVQSHRIAHTQPPIVIIQMVLGMIILLVNCLLLFKERFDVNARGQQMSPSLEKKTKQNSFSRRLRASTSQILALSELCRPNVQLFTRLFCHSHKTITIKCTLLWQPLCSVKLRCKFVSIWRSVSADNNSLFA